MSRTNMVKLYLNDQELDILEDLAGETKMPINRFLRGIIWEKAVENRYNKNEIAVFLKPYLKSYQREKRKK